MSEIVEPTFDESYYTWNGQLGDRPALWFYERMAKSFITRGRVLDFGCGMGFFIRRLSKHFRVDGFEISQYASAKAQEMVPTSNIFRTLSEIPEKKYTGITSLHVLEHIGDDELNEIFDIWRKALLPRGRLLCVIPDSSGRGHTIKGEAWFGFRDPTHINLKPRSEWQRLFHKHQFKAIKVGTDGLWDFPYTKGVPRLLDAALNSSGTVFQFLLGRPILREGAGESAIFLLELEN